MSDTLFHTSERTGKYRVQVFPALCDALALAAEPLPAAFSVNSRKHGRYRTEDMYVGEWAFGTLKNRAGYLKALAEGWPQAVEKIDALRTVLAASMAAPLDLRRKPQRGPQGDELDVHAVNTGRLDKAWTSRRKQWTKARAPLRIIVNVAANSGVSADAFFWRGAAALALAAPLAQRGYKVAVSAVTVLDGCYARKASLVQVFHVKAYGEALDTARLAGILCSPATLRHLGFLCCMHAPEIAQDGLGHAESGQDMMRHLVTSNALRHANEERMLVPDFYNERDARAWLESTSRQFSDG